MSYDAFYLWKKINKASLNAVCLIFLFNTVHYQKKLKYKSSSYSFKLFLNKLLHVLQGVREQIKIFKWHQKGWDSLTVLNYY